MAINAHGQVTGHSWTGKTITLSSCCSGCYSGGKRVSCVEHIDHAFVWSNGTMTDLGTLGGKFSAGNAINVSGEIVGSAQTKAGTSDAFLWNGSKMTDLTTTALSSLPAASVAWINDSGQIVGTFGHNLFPSRSWTATARSPSSRCPATRPPPPPPGAALG